MKGDFYSDRNETNEDVLNVEAIYHKLVVDGLYEYFKKDEDEIIEFLYPLINWNHVYRRKEDKTKLEIISNMCCSLRHQQTEAFLNTALLFARKKDFHLPGILMLIENISIEDSLIGDLFVFEPNDIPKIIDDLIYGFENDYIDSKAYVRAFYALSGDKREDKPEAYFYTFAKEEKSSEDKSQLLWYADQDYTIGLRGKHSKICSVNYHDIVCSEAFMKYLKEQNLTNDEFEYFNEIIEAYLEEEYEEPERDYPLDTKGQLRDIVNVVLKNKEKYSRNILSIEESKNLYFTKNETLFSLINS